MEIKHTPIMVKEIIEHLPNTVHLYIDGTAGHGGHIAAIAASGKLADNARIFAIDRDNIMLAKAQENTKDAPYHIEYIQDSYTSIKQILLKENTKADFILLDLGVNMEHFKDGQRGFSIHEDAPLDMRFDTTSGKTAADILNTGTGEELMHAFITYGDFSEKSAQYFFDNILKRRRENPFTTTSDFIGFLYSIGIRKTQLPVVFQCLRILTNQELTHLEQFLKDLPDLLTSGGRCSIITFHSIEDRIVKYAFKELEATGQLVLINKKVIAPHYTEVQKNRASRSAKLRIIEKK